MYLRCAQNMCANKKKCYNKIDNGWDVTKQKKIKKARAWCGCGACRRGSGNPPRATPGVLLHNRLDWQGLVLGGSR